MNDKLNPLYNALDGIDEDIAARVAVRRKPLKKIVMTALVAAAMLSVGLLVGFAEFNRGDGKNDLIIRGRDQPLYFDLYPQDLTIPEEYITESGIYVGIETDTLPTELFAKFGITPLINDSFSEEIEIEPELIEFGKRGEYVNWNGEPQLSVFENSFVEINYYLYDKNIEKNIWFNARYNLDENANINSALGVKDNEYEIVVLNDNSWCLVCAGYSTFSYKGVKYTLRIDEEISLDLTKQVLRDLKVL